MLQTQSIHDIPHTAAQHISEQAACHPLGIVHPLQKARARETRQPAFPWQSLGELVVHPGGRRLRNKILCMCFTAASTSSLVTSRCARPAASQDSTTRYCFVVLFSHSSRFMEAACKEPAVRPVDGLS